MVVSHEAPKARGSRPAALAACSLLLALYAAAAWLAVRHQSPAFDEPYHALSAWVQLHRHDYRVDAEDPPLWQYWASLPNGPSAVRFDPADPTWRQVPHSVALQWPWTVQVLYRTPSNDAAALVARCRAMMLVVAVALGVLIAAWAWRLAGPVAAVVATGLFALDPNFIAHGPLMKNDVAFTLALTGLAAALWRVGRSVTVAGVAAVSVCCAAMLTTKFSGLIAVAVGPAVLGVRVLLPDPWPAFGRALARRRDRAAAAALIIAVAAIVSYGSIWAAYGFRYRPTPLADVTLNLPELADRAASNAAFVHNGGRGGGPPRRTLAVRAALLADRHHWLPQAYVAGFLFTYGNNLVRPAYLMGERSLVGWWYYFPLAMAFKTPTATIAVVGLTAAAVAARRWWRAARWSALALAVPFAIFLASALSSDLNIGLRHVFPLYPLAFVATGWATAGLVRRRPRVGRPLVAVLFAGLAVETAVAFPNYVSFFNAPSSTAGRGGLDLLSDSNLDWGQGLLALADWRRAHPADDLYLSYFGLADPHAYGLQYIPLPGGYRYDLARRQFPAPGHPCWLAVSVTNLQGVEQEDARLRAYYQTIAARPPTAVVGGSIYVYRYDPPRSQPRASARAGS